MQRTHKYLLYSALPVALAAGLTLAALRVSIPWFVLVLFPFVLFLALVSVGLIGRLTLTRTKGLYPAPLGVGEETAGEFRQEWRPALVGHTGMYDQVYWVRLADAQGELFGWIEWDRPTGGYWQARLRFPPVDSSYVPVANLPALAHFARASVKVAVRLQGRKAATMRGMLRVEQGDLTSTWMPVRLDDEPTKYTFDIAVVDLQ